MIQMLDCKLAWKNLKNILKLLWTILDRFELSSPAKINELFLRKVTFATIFNLAEMLFDQR